MHIAILRTETDLVQILKVPPSLISGRKELIEEDYILIEQHFDICGLDCWSVVSRAQIDPGIHVSQPRNNSR